MPNQDILNILDNIFTISLSIKEKYDKLFELDVFKKTNTQEYQNLIQVIKGLKYFEQEELKKLHHNYSELMLIVKYLKEKYLNIKDETLNLIIPDEVLFKNYVTTRIINNIICYIINNFDVMYLKTVNDLSLDINNFRKSNFIIAINNYLMQDILNILLVVNHNSQNPLLKNMFVRNFYDLNYTIPYLEERLLSNNNNDYIIGSDVVNYFYGISKEYSDKIKTEFLKKLYQNKLDIILSYDLDDTLLLDNIFKIEFSKNFMKAILLLSDEKLKDEINAISTAYMINTDANEMTTNIIKSIFVSLDAEEFVFSRARIFTD